MAVEMELVGVEGRSCRHARPWSSCARRAGQRRVLPIFIGAPEAQAIALSMQNSRRPRPMTHDLMKNLLDELGAQVERIVVTELREGTFFAEIVL